jgi:hypothetical protein
VARRETEAYYRRQNVKQRRSRIPLTDRTVPANTGGSLDLPAVRVNAPLAGVTVQRMNNQGGQIDVVVGGVATAIGATRTAIGIIAAGDLVNLRLVTGFSGTEEVRFYGIQGNEIARTKIHAAG